MKVSIIIPVKEINNYIKEAMPYLLDLDYFDYEIIILPNKKTNEKFPKTRIIETGDIGPSDKRDIGAKYAKGEILAFIDDDAYPDRDWIKNAIINFEDKNIVAVGGPGITPENDSNLQKASGAVFESFLGGGGLGFRYKQKKKRFVDDFPSCNFIIRKDIFEELGGFDSKFWPGEDTKLCREIIKKNYKIIYDPKVLVWHHRRKLFLPHLKQIWNYSIHRGYFVRTMPENSLKLGYFIPSLFTMGLIFGFISSFFNFYLKLTYLFIILVYLFLLMISSINIKLLKLFPLIFSGIFLTHIIYGIGFIKGGLFGKLK